MKRELTLGIHFPLVPPQLNWSEVHSSDWPSSPPSPEGAEYEENKLIQMSQKKIGISSKIGH